MMSSTFAEMLRDETLRIEIGAAAVSDLAVENLGLLTADLSRAVRGSVIVRRADGSCVGANQLALDEVRLPPAVVAVPEPCAA
jgi:hypothetical protein